MKRKKFWLIAGVLAIAAITIKLYSNNAARVEHGYSTHFYPGIAAFFRVMFGWIPFSIGDVLYGLAFIWILYRLFRGIKALVKKQATLVGFFDRLKKFVLVVLVIYVVFNFFWGINYERQGLSSQLALDTDTISYNELKQINLLLVEKLNATKTALLNAQAGYPSSRELYSRVSAAYHKAGEQYPFLQYDHISIKSSMWGWFGNITGFTGYYNPFTGEAQVNTNAPAFMLPFVTCHEAGHQLGYAKEDEASAAGYLAAVNSGDTLLLYSTYFDLFTSARRELIMQSYVKGDTAFLKDFSKALLPAVKNDYKEMYAYFNNNKNFIKPIISSGYGFYLKNNNQPGGMHTYDEVTEFLIRYYRKIHKI